jgi:hypothetical protein
VNVIQVAIIDELPVGALAPVAHSEIEPAPGYEGGFVRQPRKVQVGLGMKFRHDLYPIGPFFN